VFALGPERDCGDRQPDPTCLKPEHASVR
jgi:hypothetical protein